MKKDDFLKKIASVFESGKKSLEKTQALFLDIKNKGAKQPSGQPPDKSIQSKSHTASVKVDSQNPQESTQKPSSTTSSGIDKGKIIKFVVLIGIMYLAIDTYLEDKKKTQKAQQEKQKKEQETQEAIDKKNQAEEAAKIRKKTKGPKTTREELLAKNIISNETFLEKNNDNLDPNKNTEDEITSGQDTDSQELTPLDLGQETAPDSHLEGMAKDITADTSSEENTDTQQGPKENTANLNPSLQGRNPGQFDILSDIKNSLQKSQQLKNNDINPQEPAQKKPSAGVGEQSNEPQSSDSSQNSVTTTTITEPELPEYEIKGRGLVYNCEQKFWSCVNKKEYFQCKKVQLFYTERKQIPKCVISDIFQSNDDCNRGQQDLINNPPSQDPCRGSL